MEVLPAAPGGATPLPATGVNVVQGEYGPVTLFEAGQIIVLAACKNRRKFLRHRNRLEELAARMAEGLDQEAAFVLATPSDSFLVEIVQRGET